MPHILFVVLLLLGCTSTPPPAAPPPSSRLEYRVDVTGVPAGAESVVLTVRLPEDGADACAARALVGNASLSLALGRGASARELACAVLRWDASERVLLVASRGRPIELVLRLVTPPGAPRVELEQALATGTHARVDDQAFAGVRARLVAGP